MKGNLNYGIIFKELRKRKGMRLKDFAKELGRSAGWLSSVENCDGRCDVSKDEFERIVELCEAGGLRNQFKSWVAAAVMSGASKGGDRRMGGQF